MRRRDLLPLLGALAAGWPLPAGAQQPRIPVIGYLSGQAPAGIDVEMAARFREGLASAGFVEGRDVTIEYRWAENQFDRLPMLAADLVGRKVDAIFAFTVTAALAAKQATSTIPIVFNIGVDPVELGLVKSWSRPEGNITGVTAQFVALHEKVLQVLHEIAPDMSSIGFLFNPKNQSSASRKQHIEAAAEVLRLKVVPLEVVSADQLELAFATGRQAGIGALLVDDEAFMVLQREQVVALAARHGFPAAYNRREFVAAGGLVSYGPQLAENRRQAGVYVGRILKGEKPADLPIQRPTRFELVINLKTATALGLTVPQSLFARADEVIE